MFCKIIPQNYFPTHKLIDLGRKCSFIFFILVQKYWDFKRKIILIWHFQSKSHLFLFFFFVKHFFSSAPRDPWKTSCKEQSFQNIFGNGKASFQGCYSKDALQKAWNKFFIKRVILKKKTIVILFSVKRISIKIFWAVLPIM